MSIFKKTNKIESNEHKFNELAYKLQLNPLYFEERRLHKIARTLKAYM